MPTLTLLSTGAAKRVSRRFPTRDVRGRDNGETTLWRNSSAARGYPRP